MRLFATFLALELRTHARSLRSRVVTVAYLALGLLPALATYLRRDLVDFSLDSSTYAAETIQLLVPLTAAVAAVLAADALTREREDGSWSTLSVAPISSALYLLLRWSAVVAILLPLTLVPLIGAGALAAAGGAPLLPGHFLWAWLLQVVPVAVVGATLGLGCATIAGGTVSGLLLACCTGWTLLAVTNRLLDSQTLCFRGAGSWLQLEYGAYFAQRLLEALSGEGDDLPFPASVAPLDPLILGEQLLASALLTAGLAAAFLGVAVAFLRRTRPDLRPRPIAPAHPLRTLLALRQRLLESYAPDAGLSRGDRAFLAGGLGLLLAALVGTTWRGLHYLGLATDRDRAELATDPPPTSPDLVPGAWRISGAVGTGGGRSVAVEVTAELVSRGRSAHRRASFLLNAGLELVAVSAAEGTVVARRDWDHLTLELEPPIPAGGRRKVRFTISGRPVEVIFPFASYQGFHTHFLTLTQRRNFYRVDISRSWTLPAISPTGVHLSASELTPVLRYPAPDPLASAGENGESRPAALFQPDAEVELALELPAGMLLADSCGNLSRLGDSGTQRLDGHCTLPLAELEVAGGAGVVPLAGEAGDPTLAVFPAHLALGKLHLESLHLARRLAVEAWPGLAGVGGGVVLEWPDDGALLVGRRTNWRRFYADDPDADTQRVSGKLLYLDEAELIRDQRLGPERLALALLRRALGSRRRVAPTDAFLFQQILSGLAKRRLGLGPRSGAVVGPVLTGPKTFEVGPRDGADAYAVYYRQRLPAILAGLERRVGAGRLGDAVDEVLSRPGEVTVAELLAEVRSGSGEDGATLERFFTEQLLGNRLPIVSLDGARAVQNGATWTVTGSVLNSGTGLADCLLIVANEMATIERRIVVEPGTTATFLVVSSHRPQAVLLDPNAECHRYREPLSRERVNL